MSAAEIETTIRTAAVRALLFTVAMFCLGYLIG